MNYTEKYHLPQWVKEDRIMMEDFNVAMAGIEAGMSGNAQAAEKAAELPYVIGKYTGDGAASQHIIVGFRPRFVIVSGQYELESGVSGGVEIFFLATAGWNMPHHLSITENGFTVFGTVNALPDLNRLDQAYDYIAFR